MFYISPIHDSVFPIFIVCFMFPIIIFFDSSFFYYNFYVYSIYVFVFLFLIIIQFHSFFFYYVFYVYPTHVFFSEILINFPLQSFVFCYDSDVYSMYFFLLQCIQMPLSSSLFFVEWTTTTTQSCIFWYD